MLDLNVAPPSPRPYLDIFLRHASVYFAVLNVDDSDGFVDALKLFYLL